MNFAQAKQPHRKSGVALPSAALPTAPVSARSLLSVTSLEVEDVSAILRLATLLEAEDPSAVPSGWPVAVSRCSFTNPAPAPGPHSSWRPKVWVRTPR